MIALPRHDVARVRPDSAGVGRGEEAAAIVEDLLTLARRGVPVDKVVCLNTVVGEYLQSPQYEELASRHPKAKVDYP